MAELDHAQARRLRARAQLLGGSALSPTEVVHRAGALQGQEPGAVVQAIALRSGATVAEVRAAFETGALVRGWPMRGTLFATTPQDLAGLLTLTAPRIHAATARNRAALGIDDAVLDRAREVALAALERGELTRAELMDAWTQAGLEPAGGRGYRLVFSLAQEGLMHWGRFEGAQQLLTRTAPAPAPDPAEVPARIAHAFLAARGPATLDDFAWWTQLPKRTLREAFLSVEGAEEVVVDGRTMLHLDDGVGSEVPAVVLLPAFDEWILGYRDRSLVASPEMLDALVPGRNGVFRPTVVLDGRVVGTWAAGARGKAPSVELVERVSARERRAIDAALEAWRSR